MLKNERLVQSIQKDTNFFRVYLFSSSNFEIRPAPTKQPKRGFQLG